MIEWKDLDHYMNLYLNAFEEKKILSKGGRWYTSKEEPNKLKPLNNVSTEIAHVYGIDYSVGRYTGNVIRKTTIMTFKLYNN